MNGGLAANGDFALQVSELQTYFFTGAGVVKAVDGISFALQRGKVLAIIGESGSGKTMTALSIMRLIPDPPGRIVGGQILFHGRDLLALSPGEMRNIRGDRIAMIFQDPMTALDPVFTVEDQIAEVLYYHRGLSKKQARPRVLELLDSVHIASPRERLGMYPHQLSGGIRQRIMIAMALACEPDILIADEPTTALDVTIQAQILELLGEIQATHGSSIIFITHDLGVAARIADHVAVMYAGKVVEYGDTRTVLYAPNHPYTEGLIKCIPKLGHSDEVLVPIQGQPVNLLRLPPGCPFAPRCPLAQPQCQQEMPALLPVNGSGHLGACLMRRFQA